MKCCRHLFLLLFLLTGLPLLANEPSNSSFVINIADSIQTPARRQSTEKFLTLLYQPLHITPSFRYTPSKKGLSLVNQGKYDAEAGRLSGVSDNYGNMLVIQPELFTISTGLFCLAPEHCSPDNDPAVVTLSAFQRSDDFCRQYSLRCKSVKTVSSVWKVLEKGLADSLFSTIEDAVQIMCHRKGKWYYKHFETLDAHLHHLIHKKHIRLQQPLSESIVSLKKSGQIKRLLSTWSQLAEQCENELEKLL